MAGSVGWAVTGALGVVAAEHIRAIMAGEQSRLVGICDAAGGGEQKARALGVRAYRDLDAMLQDPEVSAVSLCTPHTLHERQAAACLAAGRHVLSEKPLATTAEGAQQLIAAAQRQNLRLGVVYQHRWRPEMAALHRLLTGGKLGRILRATAVHTTFRTDHYFAAAPWRGRAGAGVLTNQAQHMLDLIVWLLGLPQRVLAAAGTTLHRIAVEDSISALLDYGEGVHCLLHAGCSELPQQSYVEIFAEQGMARAGPDLQLQLAEQPLGRFIREDQSHIYARPALHPAAVALPDLPRGHMAVISAFTQAVLTGGDPAVTGQDALKVVQLTAAIERAARLHKAVEVGQ